MKVGIKVLAGTPSKVVVVTLIVVVGIAIVHIHVVRVVCIVRVLGTRPIVVIRKA